MADKQDNLNKIVKRDGRIVTFNQAKIVAAVMKAVAETGEFDKGEAERLAGIVVTILHKANGKHVPTVEQVQDIVEQVLMAGGHYETAKAYILYRQKQTQLRTAKQVLGVEDDLGMSINSLKVLERKRYLRHDENNKVVETPGEMVKRVAGAIAKAEKTTLLRRKYEAKFEEIIANLEFLPAGCYFRGAGTKAGNLTNCFVLPVEDSMEGIFDAVKWTALIHQLGGGTGFDFSDLRPRGDYISKSGGFASGPVSFMRVFDAATRQVMQGGFLQGANMGVLRVDHPDIFEFIACKAEDDEITNFNVSVGATDEFMRAVVKDKEYVLKNPRNGQPIQKLSAKTLFDAMVTSAWKTGDPGMIYLDTINKNNPVMGALGPIKATNVCGEQPLHPFDCCNLGSINLARFVREDKEIFRLSGVSRNTRLAQDDKPVLKSLTSLSSIEKRIAWGRLQEVVRLGVRFLDNGVEVSRYPIPQIGVMARNLRRIGLGVMGWADMLYQLRVRYDSKEGVGLAQRVAQFIQEVSWDESERLAKEKGQFSLWGESEYVKRGPVTGKKRKVRNVAVTTIAPTGTISMVADCSSGIEPVFALSYVKNVVDEAGLTYTNKYFEKELDNNPQWVSQKQTILNQVQSLGSVKEVEGLPEEVKGVFRVAYDIEPEWHIRMQAAWQKHTDNAVSKTINFPTEAGINDIAKAYMYAWETGCKGVTVYRDRSKSTQVLSVGNVEEKQESKQVMQSKVRIKPLTERIQVKLTGEGKCPECGGEVMMEEGCKTCHACGWSACSA